MDTEITGGHGEWLRQIEAEAAGELSFAARAALARHLVGCPSCAGARASHLEMRAAMAAAAGDPHAGPLPVPATRWRAVILLGLLGLLAGSAAGWLAHRHWGAPGRGSLEGGRATFVAP